jgi:hypothetical protein
MVLAVHNCFGGAEGHVGDSLNWSESPKRRPRSGLTLRPFLNLRFPGAMLRPDFMLAAHNCFGGAEGHVGDSLGWSESPSVGPGQD